MTKLTLNLLSFATLFVLLTLPHSLCVDPPAVSPSPAPENGSDDLSPPPAGISPVSGDNSPFASPVSSPPSPPVADLSPAPSPANGDESDDSSSPATSPSPVPTAQVASDMSRESTADVESESSSGLKGGQKAGIALGVIAGVCVVGLGALVYKKRQQNIRRSEFGYAARREIL